MEKKTTSLKSGTWTPGQLKVNEKKKKNFNNIHTKKLKNGLKT